MMKWLLLALFVIAAIVIGPLTHEGWSAWPGAFAIVPGTFVLMLIFGHLFLGDLERERQAQRTKAPNGGKDE